MPQVSKDVLNTKTILYLCVIPCHIKAKQLTPLPNPLIFDESMAPIEKLDHTSHLISADSSYALANWSSLHHKPLLYISVKGQ